MEFFIANYPIAFLGGILIIGYLLLSGDDWGL